MHTITQNSVTSNLIHFAFPVIRFRRSFTMKKTRILVGETVTTLSSKPCCPFAILSSFEPPLVFSLAAKVCIILVCLLILLVYLFFSFSLGVSFFVLAFSSPFPLPSHLPSFCPEVVVWCE